MAEPSTGKSERSTNRRPIWVASAATSWDSVSTPSSTSTRPRAAADPLLLLVRRSASWSERDEPALEQDVAELLHAPSPAVEATLAPLFHRVDAADPEDASVLLWSRRRSASSTAARAPLRPGRGQDSPQPQQGLPGLRRSAGRLEHVRLAEQQHRAALAVRVSDLSCQGQAGGRAPGHDAAPSPAPSAARGCRRRPARCSPGRCAGRPGRCRAASTGRREAAGSQERCPDDGTTLVTGWAHSGTSAADARRPDARTAAGTDTSRSATATTAAARCHTPAGASARARVGATSPARIAKNASNDG